MKRVSYLVCALLWAVCQPSLADVVVIVHPSNANSLDNATIARIFLGKSKTFPDGAQAVPINLQEGSPASDAFNATVLGKNGSQLKAYWSQLVFTGKGAPPKQVDSEDELKKLIAANPNMIGYIDAAKLDASVKAVGK